MNRSAYELSLDQYLVQVVLEDRLDQVQVDAGIPRNLLLLFLLVGRHKANDGLLLRSVPIFVQEGTNRARRLRPVTNWHAVVKQNELVHWLPALLSLHHQLYGVFAVRAEVSVYIELD